MNKFEIYETKNYGLFEYIDHNREIDKKHVSTLIESIKKFGLIVPIIVSSDKYIIDGQHRLQALMQLQLPVVYVVNNKINKDCIIDINNNQKGWNLMNRIKSHAIKGNVECQRLLDLIDERYEDFSLSGITDAYNAFFGKSPSTLIRKGEYQTNEELGDQVLDNCLDLRDVIGKPAASTKFVRALKKVMFNNPHFDNERLKRNCKTVKKMYIYNNEGDIIEEIKEIYNYKLRNKKLV